MQSYGAFHVRKNKTTSASTRFYHVASDDIRWLPYFDTAETLVRWLRQSLKKKPGARRLLNKMR